jgi:hypothetical protein
VRIGQLIGAGADKKISLLCVVRKIDNVGVHAHVVNGAWDITFKRGETICHAPSGDDAITARVLYTGSIPGHLRFEYYCTDTCQEAIDFMNARINSRVPMWVYSSIGNVKVRAARLTNALAAGKQAFMEAWNPPKRIVDDYDDEIPF